MSIKVPLTGIASASSGASTESRQPDSSSPHPLRTARTGRRPGASGTRELIAAAARRQFADGGYERTSVRSVATEAGVDPSLVMRFFGNKQRLLVTVLDLPVDVDQLVRTVAEGDGREAGERLAGFVVRLLQDSARAAIITGLIRCAVSEPEAARLLRERFVRDVLTPLVMHTGMDQADIRGALVASQIHGLVLARQVLQLDALTRLGPEELARLIAPTLQRYLAEPL